MDNFLGFGRHWELGDATASYAYPRPDKGADGLNITGFKKRARSDYFIDNSLQLIETTEKYKKYYFKPSNDIVYSFIWKDGINVYLRYLKDYPSPITVHRKLNDRFEITYIVQHHPIDYQAFLDTDSKIVGYVNSLISRN